MTEQTSWIVSAFQKGWARHHGSRSPIGWLLREDDRLPWVRFHALPGSKRYADNQAERDIILRRANDLAGRLLGDCVPCWMVTADPPEGTMVGSLVGELMDVDEDGAVEVCLRFHARAVEWRAGAFDIVLAGIADEQPSTAIWMDRASGAVFAPYDGGFDLFPSTWVEVAALKAARGEWLSSHPLGL